MPVLWLKGISMKRIALTVLIVMAVAANFGLLWLLSVQNRELNEQVAVVGRKGEATDRDLRQISRDLLTVRELATITRDRAIRAEEKAIEAGAARRDAETARLQAEEQAQQAQKLAKQSRGELQEMIERRKSELARMQDALGKVAETRRTPAGLIVELSNDSFYFDFDRAELRPKNREILSRIAGILLASTGYRLFVDGHTDHVGSAEYNQQLSEKRAASVRDYLVGAGVPDDLMEVRGFGKTAPRVMAGNGQSKNRRVEIGIVDTIIDYKGPVDDR
jgi:outer membrane protein OmpA-like peptidoglycan-associated protein